MDINKEREAFEKECRLLCYKGNMVMSNLGSFYNNEQTNWMWQMWLSAKAQAVPEGFVLVPKEPNYKIMKAITSYILGENQHGVPVGLEPIEAEEIYELIVQAAQEPADD